MKNFVFALLALLVILVGNGVAYAQYGQEAKNPQHESLLQKQLDLAKIGSENEQTGKQRIDDLNNAKTMMLIGIPMAVAISVSVFLFKKR